MESFFIITHISKNRKIDAKKTHLSFNDNQTRDINHQDKQIAKKNKKTNQQVQNPTSH